MVEIESIFMSTEFFDESKYFLGHPCWRQHDWNSTGQSLRSLRDRTCVDCKRLYKTGKKMKGVLERSPIKGGKALGKLCSKGHDWEGTGQSLRYIDKNGKVCGCLECISERNKAKNKGVFVEPIPTSNQTYLGRLCPAKHGWNGLERSLRYASTQSCVECLKARDKRFIALCKEDPKNEKAIKYREGRRKSAATWRKNNPEKVSQRSKLNQHRFKNSRLRYWNSDRGRINNRKNASRYRAKKKAAHTASFSVQDVIDRLQSFENKCCYCSEELLKPVYDHFIPLSKGGSHVLGNLVCCCVSCNSSKSDRDPKEWYCERPFFSPSRWRKILQILGKTEENYNQIPLL